MGKQQKPKINPDRKPSGSMMHLVSGWVAALVTEIEVSQLVSEKSWGYLGCWLGNRMNLVSRRGSKKLEGGAWLAGPNRYGVLAATVHQVSKWNRPFSRMVVGQLDPGRHRSIWWSPPVKTMNLVGRWSYKSPHSRDL